MHYTLHQLRIFLQVVDLKSITKASQVLHLTQPAVSIQLKNLQNQFEIPLIEVIGKQVFITRFGQEVAESARKIISEIDEIEDKTLAHKGVITGHLKLSVVSTGKYVMPYFLTQFIEKYRGISVQMDVTNKASVVEDLENNLTDFALVSVLPEHLNMERVELMKNQLHLVRKKEKNPSSKVMYLKSLGKLPFIYREEGSATRRAMETYIQAQNLKLPKTMELTSNEAVKQAILAGLGYSIMPLIGLRNELANEQIELVNITGLPLVTHWNLVWLKDKRLSPAAQAYLSFIEAEKDNIIKRDFSWATAYMTD